MNCSQFRQFYSDFADGLLDEADTVAFHIHLAECAACAKFDAALRCGCDALRDLQPPEPSGDFDEALYERILQDCRPETPSMRHWSGLAGAALIVAVVGVAGWQAHVAGRAAAPNAPQSARRAGASALDPFVVRFAGDTSIRYPGRLPVIPVSNDTFRSASRPARSFEITVDWMTP